nr:uncharacterized protein LOC123765380 [Procambarus clarkii]
MENNERTKNWTQIISIVSFLMAAVHKISAQGVTDPRCQAPYGNFPDASRCDGYISCWGGRGFSQRCGTGLVFNPVTKLCQAGTSCPGETVGAPDSGQSVRLSGGGGPWAGYLQVRYQDKWAYVDARGWTHELGRVVCGQLGYVGYESGSGVVAGGTESSSTTTSPPVVQLGCPGGISSLSRCRPSACTSCRAETPVLSIRCTRAPTHRCPSQPAGGGGAPWERWRDNCFMVLDNYRATKDSASAMCRERGAQLLTIDSQAEHEYISELLGATVDDNDFYTDGVGVTVGGLRVWAWGASHHGLQHSKWWPGWNATGRRTFSTAPTGSSTSSASSASSCLVLKKSYPLTEGSSSTYDSGFYYYHPTDCLQKRPFVCKASVKDVGCYEGDGTTYSGRADLTISGRTCLLWTDPKINSLDEARSSSSRARNFNLALIGAHNYCRNPDGAQRPWCFVDGTTAEACDVLACTEDLSVSPSPGAPVRTSTLLRPLQATFTTTPNPFIFTTTPATTTTTTATTTTTKVRCRAEDHTCESGDTCLDQKLVCDGERHCPRGDDEHLCKRFLQGFEVRRRKTLLDRQVLKTLTRADVGVCAKRCLDDTLCRGFIYDQVSKECFLSASDVATSGLVTSAQEEFYELRARRTTCGLRFICGNERCVGREKVCDGLDNCGDNTDESQCGQSRKHELRLVGGQGGHQGNIQVKVDDEWGYVCDDGFGFEEADLVCRSLGYSSAQAFTRNNHFGKSDSKWRRSSPKFWLDKLACTGSETSLLDCPSSGLGVHDCGPTEIAGVTCRTVTSLCNEDQFQCGTPRLHTCVHRTQVCDETKDCFDGSDEAPSLCDDVGVTRLASSSSKLVGATAGTVYIKHFGRWGTVCDDAFDENHAKVVCRSLGYEGGWTVAYPRAFFGRGTSDILLDEAGCRGNEDWLGQCLGVVWGVTDCDHSEDVGVLCSDEIEVRLSNGPTVNSGRVEVKLSGQWGTICDDDFDDYEAKVICRMLGYHGDAVAHKAARYGQGTGPVWLDSMDCLGTETDLKQCKKSQPGASDCAHAEDASVTCYPIKRGAVNLGLQTALPDGCGRRSDTSSSSFLIDNFAKIIGGSTQEPLEHPWLVSLQLREEGKLKHNCGGVVIAEDYVLTAAHCFKVHGRNSYVVRVGDYSLNTREGAQEDFQIEKLWMHDDFDMTVEFNNDIAVLKVGRKNGRGIRFGKSVQPACLPSEEASYSSLSECSITGWGTTSERAPPIPQDLPRSGRVQIYNMSSCTGQNKYGLFEVTSGMVCAGNLDGRIDTCTGDSGGPLTCYINGRHVLYGITSWGKGCGRRGQPGMYTKITKFLRWIHDIIV